MTEEDQADAVSNLRDLVKQNSNGAEVVKKFQEYLKLKHGSTWLCFIGDMRAGNSSPKYEGADHVMFNIGKQDMLLIRNASIPAAAEPKMSKNRMNATYEPKASVMAAMNEAPGIRYSWNFEPLEEESLNVANQAIKIKASAQHQANHIKDHFKVDYPDADWQCIVSDKNIEMGSAFSWMPSCILFTIESKQVLIVRSPKDIGETSGSYDESMD
ncbi:hypothetical protein HDE_04111 [Halotydeus destructor]|nr:hypothetical protein HDE_04111 [Halotydeus destructor]